MDRSALVMPRDQEQNTQQDSFPSGLRIAQNTTPGSSKSSNNQFAEKDVTSEHGKALELARTEYRDERVKFRSLHPFT